MTNIDLPTAESIAGGIASQRELTSSRSADVLQLLETADSGIVVPVSGGGAEGWIFVTETGSYLDARRAAELITDAIDGSDLVAGAPATPTAEHLETLRTRPEVYAFDLVDSSGKTAYRVAILINIGTQGNVDLTRFDRVSGVPLTLTVELGRASMTIGEVLDMRAGQVVTLDSASGEPANLFANGKLIARGDITVVDQQFAIHITEILDTNVLR